jgi:1-aminocyclopropane-1-carboxylate deaminase/D-cysteine desulfhydrase-like pyridoxal-dependent ACC family enzyme
MIPLFEHYPLLTHNLPYVSLGVFPTPVQKLDRLGQEIGVDNLYFKRDDLSGKVFGGNKLRKLEFILGNTLRTGKKEVMTFGAAGSNHALATAIYARQLGLSSISMLVAQPNAQYIRRNLLLSHHVKAELHQYSNLRFLKPVINPAVLYQLLCHRLKKGQLPMVIPMGGSYPLGVIGFVNAAYELEEQIRRREIDEPDYIYVAAGSMGTAAGLVVGLKALQSKTRVVAVRVNNHHIVNEKRMINLIHKTNSFLSAVDPSFPRLVISGQDIDIRHRYSGGEYALFTPEGMTAVNLVKKYSGIQLEGTYTGKAFAALIDEAKKPYLKNKVLLFWNTYNSLDFSETIANIDYHLLPRCFHRYFEDKVQPLEME